LAADDKRKRSRLVADASSGIRREGAVSSTFDGCREADELIHRERSFADQSLFIERYQGDCILAAARKRSEVFEAELLDAERRKTDLDLKNERDQCDIDAKRAATALTTRDEFLAIVSHDLRNPLGSITMAAQILMSSSALEVAGNEARELVEIINRNAAEALRLISDLMDMECIAVGKLGLNIESHDISQIVSHSISSIQHVAESKRVSLQSSCAENGINITCDRDRISQVISNLLGNAIKFTPSGGSIALCAVKKAGCIRLSVSDTGPGISEEMRTTIFRRFWQLGKQDRQGLGLGLYISKMIVEAHQGHLWVESTVGAGSVFQVELPC
jgi:signal transduction histidine kinase